MLLTHWQQSNWQYFMAINPNGTMSFTLRRNMQTSGSDPSQDLVTVTTKEKVPGISQFFKVVYVYNNIGRKLSVFIDDVLSGSSVVRAELTYLTLHTSTQRYVQFGNKGDDSPTTGALNRI